MTAVTEVKGVGETLGKSLSDNGFKTAEAIAKAKPADLVKVPRVGAARAATLIAAAKEATAPKPATTKRAARKPAAAKPAAAKTA
ncbi:MAG: helix-hairpin-helix domain-containing protein, partial [Arenibacterium sp.]